jgi:quinol monooxygenase YgiN
VTRQTQYLRIFYSAVDPADVDEVTRLFEDDVKPVFASSAGCVSMELVISTDKNAGGLVDGAAISRWSSLDAMEAAIDSREVAEAMIRVRQLLRQEPVSRVFEVLA